MDLNAEFLTTRDLKVRCIKELPIEKQNCSYVKLDERKDELGIEKVE